MMRLKSDVRIYLASSPSDGRKGMNGLCASVTEFFIDTTLYQILN